MSTYFEGDTDYAVAPGEFIRDWIDENEVSQAWLARQLEYPASMSACSYPVPDSQKTSQ